MMKTCHVLIFFLLTVHQQYSWSSWIELVSTSGNSFGVTDLYSPSEGGSNVTMYPGRRMTNLPLDLKPEIKMRERQTEQIHFYRSSEQTELSKYQPVDEDGRPICRPYTSLSAVFVADGKYPFYVKKKADGGLIKTSPFYYTLVNDKGPHDALYNNLFLHPFNRDTTNIAVTGFTDWADPKSPSFYCYELSAGIFGLFTDDEVPTNILPDKDSDEWDSTLNAVYFSAIDFGVDLNADTNVIVFISNNKWKHAEDNNPKRGPEYNLPAPDGKHSDSPCEQGPVSKKVLFNALEAKNILLIGLLTSKIYSEYKNFFNSAKTPGNYRMLEITGTDATAAARVTPLIMPIIRERVCTCKVQYEFALVIDSTQTFIEKFRTSRPAQKESYLDKAMPKITFIVDKILKEDPSAKLHLTTFGDYPTDVNNNANATYCYRYELTTSNGATFLAAVKNVDSTYGGKDDYESSLTALLYTATEPKIKWSPKRTKHLVKIIAVASDTFWKSYSDKPSKAGPEYEYPEGPTGGYGDCSHRPPRTNNVLETLAKEDFHLLPIIYGWISSDNWNNTFQGFRGMKDKYYMESEAAPSSFGSLSMAINRWANETCNG